MEQKWKENKQTENSFLSSLIEFINFSVNSNHIAVFFSVWHRFFIAMCFFVFFCLCFCLFEGKAYCVLFNISYDTRAHIFHLCCCAHTCTVKWTYNETSLILLALIAYKNGLCVCFFLHSFFFMERYPVLSNARLLFIASVYGVRYNTS